MAAPELLDLPAEITKFYRYQKTEHLEWLRPIILEHKIYVPTVPQLNDKRECKPRFMRLPERDVARYFKRSYWLRHPHLTLEQRADKCGEVDWLVRRLSPEDLQRQLADALYERTEGTYVFSMSKRWDNEMMWAKYSDNHRGYCLEFTKVGIFDLVRPVNYYNGEPLEFDIRRGHDDVAFAWTHYKSDEWDKEEELRLVQPQMAPGPVFNIEPQALTRILLGTDISAADKAQILEWAEQRNPRLTVAQVSFDRYRHEMSLVNILFPA